jgi:hypothetical protein
MCKFVNFDIKNKQIDFLGFFLKNIGQVLIDFIKLLKKI